MLLKARESVATSSICHSLVHLGVWWVGGMTVLMMDLQAAMWPFPSTVCNLALYVVVMIIHYFKATRSTRRCIDHYDG